MSPTGRCWAEINLPALRHNVAVVRAQVGQRVRVMAIVKANAYGHGLPEIVRALADTVEMFGVANLEEALRVRRELPHASVFILGPALAEEREEIVRNGFVPAVSSFEEAEAYHRLCAEKPVPVHVAIDTGMGRIGVWQDEAVSVVQKIRKLSGVELAGIATHLPVADEDEEFTREELEQFDGLLAQLRAAGVEAPFIHSLNSAGIIRFPQHAKDMVRAGLMLYGSSPVAVFQQRLQPVLSLKARVLLVRHVGAGRGISYGRTFITRQAMDVATLGIGYADGFQRQLSNRAAQALIRGQRCDVLGRVTMDQIMVDVSAVSGVVAGDEAVLIGRQGEQEIFAAELAQKAGTIAWEIFTGIGSRVCRVYL
jgi:alanine racemase